MHPQLQQYSLYILSHQYYSSHIPLLQHDTLHIPVPSTSSVLVTHTFISALFIMLDTHASISALFITHTSTSALSLHITDITILNFGTIITSGSILYFSTTHSSHQHPQLWDYYYKWQHSLLQHYTFLTSASSTMGLLLQVAAFSTSALHIPHITILNYGTIITSGSILYFSTTYSSHHDPQLWDYYYKWQHPLLQHYSLYNYFIIIHYRQL